MEMDHPLIKDRHSSNEKPGGSERAKLLYRAAAGKATTVRGLCGEAELCGPLTVMAVFTYASDWRKTNTQSSLSLCLT